MSIKTRSNPEYAQIWASSGDGEVNPIPSLTPAGLRNNGWEPSGVLVIEDVMRFSLA